MKECALLAEQADIVSEDAIPVFSRTTLREFDALRSHRLLQDSAKLAEANALIKQLYGALSIAALGLEIDGRDKIITDAINAAVAWSKK
jgi:hypothetical protein